MSTFQSVSRKILSRIRFVSARLTETIKQRMPLAIISPYGRLLIERELLSTDDVCKQAIAKLVPMTKLEF